ncbi:hypothetical protein HDU89_005259 [Geranomyces variabilis]|nr:hypothetical protein HDU89_005259 [Geranomyces variabilis]
MPDIQGEEIDAGDVDWETLRFKPLQVEAKLRLSEPLNAPEHCSLLATSSKYGYAVCGTTEGFAFVLLKDVRSALREATKGTIVPFPNARLVSISNDPVVHLKLSADQLVVVACTASGVLYLYSVEGAGDGAPPMLLKQLKLDGPVLDIQPNPEFMPQSAAVLSMEGRVQIVGFSQNITVLHLTDVTTISWSKKGKQLACGLKDGSIVQVTPEGLEKRRITPPPSLNNQPVTHLTWIETPTFLATYGHLDPADTSECPVYLITQTGVPKVSTYIKLRDPLFPEDGRKSHYYVEHFPSLSHNIAHMIACGNANAVELGFFGCDKDGAWANWTLGDGMGVETPLNAAQDNTFLVGLAVDVTSEEELPPDTPDAPPTPPVPILLTYTTEGLLLAYHCLDGDPSTSGGRCEMMCKAEVIPGSSSANTPLAKPATIPVSSAAPSAAPEPKPSVFGATKLGIASGISVGNAASAAPPTMFGGKPPAQAAAPTALSQEAKAAPLFPAFGTASKSALPGQASPGFGAALKSAQPAKTGPASGFGTAPMSEVFGSKPTAGGGPLGFAQKATDTQKPPTPAQPTVASGLTGVRGLAGPKPSLPASVSPAPTVKLQPATPVATKTAVSTPASRSSPIPSVQSVVKPVLAASARQSPQPTAMQPLRTAAPAESDPPEIIQSKFIEMYDAFCDEMKNFGVRLTASAKTVEKAKTPVVTNGQHAFEDWTLADLPLLVDRTSIVARKAQLHQQRLAALHEETKTLLASLPQEVALANECQRRLDALDDPDTAQHMRDAPLGPEDADLRDSILQRYKSVERSLQRVQDYMEQLRCEERGAANRQLLRKPDWHTICAITTHITRGTENHLQVLERLQMRIHSLQPKSKTSATAAAPVRKQRGYGLLGISDSDSDSDREDEIVGTAAKADAIVQRQIAFRALLKAAAADPARKARLNQRAHTNHAALRVKDPEAFAKARAAMLLPPSDADKAAPRTPRTTKDVLATINADMKFPEIKDEPLMVQQQQPVSEPAKPNQESPQAPSPQPPSFGFGSPGASVFNTPSKMPTGGFGGFGKPPVFGVPAAVKTEKDGTGVGWIKVESESQRPAVSRADATSSTISDAAPLAAKVEEPPTVSFASSAGTKASVSSLSASPSPTPKLVARKLSFSAATPKAEVEERSVREEEPASATDDEVFTSSALGSESGWVNVKDEQPGSGEDEDAQQTFQDSAEPSSAEDYDAVEGQQPQAEEEAATQGEEQEYESAHAQQDETAEIEEDEIVSPDESAQAVEESTIEETSNAEYSAEEVEPSTVVEDSSVISEIPSSGLVAYGQSSDDEGEADVTAIQGESTLPDEPSTVPGESGDVSASIVEITEEIEPTASDVEEEVSTLEPSSVQEPPSPTSLPADENAMDEGQPADDGLASAFGTGFGSLGTSTAPSSAVTAKPSVFGGFGSTVSTAPAFGGAAATPAFGSSLPKPAASAFGTSTASPSPFGSLAQQQQTPASSSPAASVFGQPATPAPATAAPAFGFGTSASATPASAFGSTASVFGQSAAKPASLGFGSAAPQPAASVFGQNTTSSSTGFGSSVPAAAAFGQSQPTSFGFGSSGGGGAATAAAFGSPFGGSMASAAGAQFGSRSAGFGPSAFGASPAAAGAGVGGGAAGGAVFGGSPLAANTGGLGAMAQSIKQASQSGGGFGSYAAKPAGFASSASPGFGGFGAQQPAQSGFGGFGSQPQAPQQQTTFGGFGGAAAGMQQSNGAASVFGSAAGNTASPFGSGGSVFGSQQQPQAGSNGGFGGFGSAANGGGAFGQQQPAAASVFGASTNSTASVFGSNSGTPANKFASFGSHRG